MARRADAPTWVDSSLATDRGLLRESALAPNGHSRAAAGRLDARPTRTGDGGVVRGRHRDTGAAGAAPHRGGRAGLPRPRWQVPAARGQRAHRARVWLGA